MIVIRRKYRSFTVIQGKARYTARRREDTFFIFCQNLSFTLEYHHKDLIRITGDVVGKVRKISKRGNSPLIMEIQIENRKYFLSITEDLKSFYTDSVGAKINFERNVRMQEVTENSSALDTSILYGVFLLIAELIEEDFFS